MAQKIEQFSRLLHHRLTTQGALFTIPTSNDHTDETWSATDLYIGEIGINVTDDKIYMRTNNGIVQIATGTSSGVSSTASSSPWTFTGTNIEIGATFTANAVTRKTGVFTDLGSSTLRWKDLYLGGSTTGFTTISTNLGFEISDSVSRLISTANASINQITIQIATQSSSGAKSRVLHLNSTDTQTYAATKNAVFVGSNNSKIYGGDRNIIVGGNQISLTASCDNVVYLGLGYNRFFNYSDSVGVGGKLVVRGVDDDGSGQYNESEWITGQKRLTTSNALTYAIFSIPMNMTYGEAVMVKAYVLGVDTSDATLVHSNELLFTGVCDGASASIIPSPIINEIDSFNDNVEVTVGVDNSVGSSDIELYVKGTATNTIQWLVTYSYQRLINI
jgi:hypothetical protein